MTALCVPGVEVLRLQPEMFRAGQALEHMSRALSRPTMGGPVWALLWGPGHPNRQAEMKRLLGQGRRVIALDLAYWSRDRKIRVSIDAPHPQAWVMRRDWPIERLNEDCPPIYDAWNPEGPVMVAGIGRKATIQYGGGVVEAWEQDMASQCRRRGWKVMRRQKPITAQEIGQIDRALSGCSLVVTYHSNVAIDAIRLGIPVVCKDGAAAAISLDQIPEVVEQVPREYRLRFLRNLAWFQWDPAREAAACWTWLRELLA